jgi:ACS family hexuronate transporter-like MFS transporter
MSVKPSMALDLSESQPSALRSRWGAISVFIFASSYLNFLDRQLLAAAAPSIRETFQISNAEYGQLISAFSLAYAFTTPLFGLLMDALGLTRGMILAVSIWSAGSGLTGIVGSFRGLLTCRALLGIGESAGIPAASKASASYLPPEEYGFANAVGSIAVALGSISAPLLVATVGARYGWRSLFVLSAVVALPWIVIWQVVSKRIRPHWQPPSTPMSLSRTLLKDKRLWGIAAAYALVMAQYTLWLNWTTIYFVDARHLTAADANRYFAWIPPIGATLGGFFGAFLARHWIKQGGAVIPTRLRVYGVSIPLLFSSALVPWLPTPELAALGIGLSFFASMSIVTAVHALPIDIFGVRHAAFSVSVLACAYAALQTFFSPLVGAIVDRVGFTPVCLLIPAAPIIGLFIIRSVSREDSYAR